MLRFKIPPYLYAINDRISTQASTVQSEKDVVLQLGSSGGAKSST
jgi:hypothetical protein|eukprot:SAG25_NODE_30_length_20554_cov_36.028694_19_plen_45_part_00